MEGNGMLNGMAKGNRTADLDRASLEMLNRWPSQGAAVHPQNDDKNASKIAVDKAANSNERVIKASAKMQPQPSPPPSVRSSSPSLNPSSGDADESEFEHRGNEQSEILDSSRLIEVSSPKPISKTLPPTQLDDIPEEKTKKRRSSSTAKPQVGNDERVLKLSPSMMTELTSMPESLPLPLSARSVEPERSLAASPMFDKTVRRANSMRFGDNNLNGKRIRSPSDTGRTTQPDFFSGKLSGGNSRPGFASRAISTPNTSRQDTWDQTPRQPSPTRRPPNQSSRPEAVDVNHAGRKASFRGVSPSKPDPEPEFVPLDVPLPPMSIPTYLQLEMASTRPSPLYIQRPTSVDYPYESSRIKFERLLNFLLLPPQLEQVLWFGALTCLDAWLSTFTILPLRFIKACVIVLQHCLHVLARESRFIAGFIYHGSGRMWHRRGRALTTDSAARSRSVSTSSRPAMSTNPSYQVMNKSPEGTSSIMNGTSERLRELERRPKRTWGRRHRRQKSQPSALSRSHKADLLHGMVIICSSMILMSFDASRMYHSIRGQSAMKLYVLYNLLEVVDRLFAALGQDIFECLTSEEILGRDAHGRSLIMRPLGMFILANAYNVVHSVALFYQVITLNVAVNSYSNALLTLLMSNQFVEIKSTVFKKFEKENLFQLTCADVVERFQLWLMLIIIGMRNIVEVGGLSITSGTQAAEAVQNATSATRSSSIFPNSFSILPVWTGEVLSPFIIVLGSEMLVDWIKHAYISKFNNVKPVLYQKYLDVLAKDYYTNAFINQNLVKRLGLPVIPLSCLFIRGSVQTYHMFLATHLPPPSPSSTTELILESEAASSSPTAAALEHFDMIIRKALGRSTFGSGVNAVSTPWYMIDTDDVIAFITMFTFFFGFFLVLLACKLVLGMVLLSFARNRYRRMKEREHLVVDTKGKRLGGWGMVEVDDEKKKWIYEDDPEGAKGLRERERKAADKAAMAEKAGVDFEKVMRYEMAAKRIW